MPSTRQMPTARHGHMSRALATGATPCLHGHGTKNQGQDGEEIERQSISGELQTQPALEKIGRRGRL